MRLNFTIYGSQFTYGWLPDGARLIGARDFVAEAARRGFSGAEVPARLLESCSADDLVEVRRLADARGLELVVSAFGTDVDYLAGMVRAADALGAGVLRTVVGGADYGGDRRAFAGGGWARFMDGVRDRLGRVLRVAERTGVAVAVENHQDVDSHDLLALCRGFDSPQFGVVLDAANPLATAEHPLVFAEQMLPWIKYVHLKDYQIHWSDEGYRLARCPVGSGVVPYAELLPLLHAHGRGASASLELAALEARHVRVFADDWWPEYAPRDARALAHALAFVHAHARPPGEDWRTPFERGAAAAEVAAYEEQELRASVALCAALTGDQGPARALG